MCIFYERCAGPYFWRSIAYPEACPTRGDDPVHIALIAPSKDDGTDADLVVGDDLETGTHISRLCEQALEHRAGAIGGRISRCGIADCCGERSVRYISLVGLCLWTRNGRTCKDRHSRLCHGGGKELRKAQLCTDLGFPIPTSLTSAARRGNGCIR